MSEAALRSQYFDLKKLGYNYDSIASELGCSNRTVYRYFKKNHQVRHFKRLLIEMSIASIIKKKQREIEEKQPKI